MRMLRAIGVFAVAAMVIVGAYASTGTLQHITGASNSCTVSGLSTSPTSLYGFALNWQTFTFVTANYIPTPCRDIYGNQSSAVTLTLTGGQTAGMSWVTVTGGGTLTFISNGTAMINGSTATKIVAPQGSQVMLITDGTNWSVSVSPGTASGSATPTTGQTVTPADGVTTEVVSPAGTLAALTYNIPFLNDGACHHVLFTQIITALTVAAPNYSGSILGATLAAATANSVYTFCRQGTNVVRVQ